MSRTGWIVVALVALVVVASRFYPFGGAQRQAASGAPMVEVSMPELDGPAEAGAAVFKDNCATCHGSRAEGREGRAPPLVHKIYEPGHHADAAFQLAVKTGVRQHHWPFGNMPPVEGLSEQEVARIVAYVRSLQKANGIF